MAALELEGGVAPAGALMTSARAEAIECERRERETNVKGELGWATHRRKNSAEYKQERCSLHIS
jgi:hypothetical protein